MIKIDYSDGIRITTENLEGIFKKEQLPLKVQIKNVVSKKIVWEINLNSGMWASYPSNEINDVVINDAQGNFVYRYYWNVIEHGSIFYKSLWLYCKSLINAGKKPKGLVVGTHDGEFGEWVPVIKNYMSEVLLVEGSEEQFNKLKENYSSLTDVKILKDIITPDGNDVEFFEGGKGYTNTVVKRVIDYWEKEEIFSTKRTSTSISELIKNKLGKVDWIHLDVEGLDAKLIMSLEEDLIPPFIIYEDFNLIEEEKNQLLEWFKKRGFIIHSENGIGMAKKTI